MRQKGNNPVFMGQVYVAGGRMQLIQCYHLDGAMTSQCYSIKVIPFFLLFLGLGCRAERNITLGFCPAVLSNECSILLNDLLPGYFYVLPDDSRSSVQKCEIVQHCSYLFFRLRKHANV